ncbi:MAG: T9SS type A sorting domain-containing protein [Calditrichaeota bacterium]|nr:T9SS type A sorting domain-containing protein [Calditrichota bacterium]MCB9391768.1 T9SS type A sorting domain-containing protein [Calditrichota bacterium]
MLRYFLFALLLLGSTTLLFARSNYTGYSGAPGALGRCASTCHGQSNGTVQITGFPTSYVPDSTYLITITAVSGSSINNFNGSIRVGTGSVNAGVISSGSNTSTYNVSQETNGIHLSANNRTSGTFNWHAPASGTGTVRLYASAHQGTSMSGANTNITLVATELVIETPPAIATNPVPANNATDVSVTTTLSWAGGDGATSFNVYLGPSDPPDFMGTTTEFTFSLPIDLFEETTYYWRVDAVNDIGTTTGNVWTFTTEAAQLPLPGQASNPVPADGATDVPISTVNLYWSPADFAESYDVYLGVIEPLEFLGSTTDTLAWILNELLHEEEYMWRVDAINESGTTEGVLWSFTTEAESDADDAPLPTEFTVGSAYPNPFNSQVRISLTVPNESPVTARIYNRTGQLVATLLDNARVGTTELEWNAAGLAAGVYFLKCECANITQTQKLIYLP